MKWERVAMLTGNSCSSATHIHSYVKGSKLRCPDAQFLSTGHTHTRGLTLAKNQEVSDTDTQIVYSTHAIYMYTIPARYQIFIQISHILSIQKHF